MTLQSPFNAHLAFILSREGDPGNRELRILTNIVDAIISANERSSLKRDEADIRLTRGDSPELVIVAWGNPLGYLQDELEFVSGRRRSVHRNLKERPWLEELTVHMENDSEIWDFLQGIDKITLWNKMPDGYD